MTSGHSRLLITPATSEDSATIAELGRRTFRETYESSTDPAELDDYVNSAFAVDRIAAQLRAPSSHFFLAREQSTIVGYLHLRVVAAPPCVVGPRPIELSRLYLEQSVQGKGFGLQLMQFALDESRRLDRETIWLGVYDQNVRAREFYRRWRFEDVGTREFEFGGKVYHDPVMSRPVSQG